MPTGMHFIAEYCSSKQSSDYLGHCTYSTSGNYSQENIRQKLLLMVWTLTTAKTEGAGGIKYLATKVNSLISDGEPLINDSY